MLGRYNLLTGVIILFTTLLIGAVVVSVIIGVFFEISYSQDTIEKRMQKARIEAMKGWSRK